MKRPYSLLITILITLLICVSFLLWIFLTWKPVPSGPNTANIKRIGYIGESGQTISKHDQQSYAQVLAVADGFAYIVIPICVDDTDDALRYTCNMSQIRVVDVSDPTTPQEIGVTAPLETISEMAIAGNFAYAPTAYGVNVFDISNRLSPVKVDSYKQFLLKKGFNIAEIYNLHVENDKLYLTFEECILGVRCEYAEWTFDITTAPTLTKIQTKAITEDEASPYKTFTKDYIYTIHGANGLTITDRSNPAKDIGYYNTPVGVSSVAVGDNQDGYFYISDQYGSLYILQLVTTPK